MKHRLVAVAIGAMSLAAPASLRAQPPPSSGIDADARMCSTIRHAALVETATNATVFRYRDAFERLCQPQSAPHPLRAALTPEHCDQAESAAVIAEINKASDAFYWSHERARCRALAEPMCPNFIGFERSDLELALAVSTVLGDGSHVLFDDHGHVLGVMVEPFPAQCQGTIDYAAAQAAEWLIDYPEDRAKGAAQVAAGIRELQQFLEQSAAEESARQAAERLTDARSLEASLAADRRHYEVLATLRALIPVPPDPLQQLMDQQRRDAATAALRRIGFELSEINEGLRQLELQRASRTRRE
jgi:hypothetical protein